MRSNCLSSTDSGANWVRPIMALASTYLLPLSLAWLMVPATAWRCGAVTDVQPSPPVVQEPLAVREDAGFGEAGEDDGEEARWLQEAQKRQRGEPADMDLDGVPDSFSEPLPGGGRREWVDSDGDGRWEWQRLTDAAGNEREEFDPNGDGILNKISVRTRGLPERFVLTEDSDWDGRMDRRTTMTLWPTGKRVLVETDSDGDGIFTVESDELLPPYTSQQGGPSSAPAHSGPDAGLDF